MPFDSNSDNLGFERAQQLCKNQTVLIEEKNEQRVRIYFKDKNGKTKKQTALIDLRDFVLICHLFPDRTWGLRRNGTHVALIAIDPDGKKRRDHYIGRIITILKMIEAEASGGSKVKPKGWRVKYADGNPLNFTRENVFEDGGQGKKQGFYTFWTLNCRLKDLALGNNPEAKPREIRAEFLASERDKKKTLKEKEGRE